MNDGSTLTVTLSPITTRRLMPIQQAFVASGGTCEGDWAAPAANEAVNDWVTKTAQAGIFAIEANQEIQEIPVAGNES